MQLFNEICIMHSNNAEAFGSPNRIDYIIYTIDSHGSWGKSGTQLGAHKGYLTHLVTLFSFRFITCLDTPQYICFSL